MNRCAVALFTAASLCTTALGRPQPKGAATSLELNSNGIGHMLVVPYFSTQGGNATLLNLFNASAIGKAVKIRFRGAGNGDELFSFQLFLRGRDAWAVNVSAGADGLPVLSATDRSCTLPAAVLGEPFRISRLNPALPVTARANEAREGYIEIIAMGDVIAGTALDSAIANQVGGPSCTPSVLGALARFDAQLAPPSTGLMANWILINVPRITVWSGEATAYEARHDGTASTGNNVFFPQTAAPLSGTDVLSYTSDPLYNFANGGPIVLPASLNLPDLSTPYTAVVTSPQEQATELSLDIAAQETVVEYLTDPNIQASTDWVVSMPTRRYHAAVDYRGPTLITNRGTFGDASAVYFSEVNQFVSSAGQSCQMIPRLAITDSYDREGNSTVPESTVFPPAIDWLTYCGVVSVLSTGDDAGVSSRTMQASATRTPTYQPVPGSDGLAYLKWSTPEGAKGLPVLVRQFSRAVGPPLGPGIAGTFGFSTAGRVSKAGHLP